MKVFEVVIGGQHEEAVAAEIMAGICKAIQNHGYSDVLVRSKSVREESTKQIEIPDFMGRRNYV